MAIRIIAIRKKGGDHYDPDSAVEAYQWIDENNNTSWNYRIPVAQWVQSGGVAYVWDNLKNKAIFCEYRKNVNGTEYLQTVSDGDDTNNLLELPSF